MNQQQHQQPSHVEPTNSLAIDLLPSLPLLMHSAGDALPEEVSPESTAVLSTLVEQYISSLVTAAMDAHDVRTNGEVVGGGAVLGIPYFNEKRQSESSASNNGGVSKKRKIEYWDEPLKSEDDIISSEEDDAPLLASGRRSSISSTSSLNEMKAVCTAALLDIHTSRSRKHYVTPATALDVKSFIFPICHDAVLYQRVKELQSQRRQIKRDLTEGQFMKAMREEGGELSRGAGSDAWDAIWGTRLGNSGDVADVGAVIKAGLVDGEGVEATWPGLDILQREGMW